jgi:molybdate transport system substrate-binding protein
MYKSLVGVITTVLAAGIFVFSETAHAAEIRVLATAAVQEIYNELGPQFENASGHKLVTTWAGTVDVVKKIGAGESFDLVLVAANSLDELAKMGRFGPGSITGIAKSGIGVAVPAGAKKPDLSSGDALKRTLLSAKSIAYSTGPSGVYMAGLIQKMGIADELKPRIKIVPPGSLVGEVVARGEADIGFQQTQEFLSVKGIQFVGPLPPDVQVMTLFSGGIPVNAKEIDGARALVKFMTAPAATPVIKKTGMEPA